MSTSARPISLTLAALGGEGGGVVASWLTSVARTEGWLAQATSVPGVAQRTGATIYYLEFFPEAALPADGRRPIMALMPSAGDVDIVVASEWVEAGRAITRGFVTPERTTLIASTHRAYTISEKAHLGDGRVADSAILEQAQRRAKRLVAYDMAALAEAHGTVISAVILGAIAGASGLPFPADAYRRAIRDGGIAIERNLAAFDASFERACQGESHEPLKAPAPASQLPEVLAALRERIAREFASPAHATLTHGVARLLEYQDERYAAEYLDRLVPIAALDRDADARLTEATARGLALWMSFEDTIRVADLKIRPERLAAIRAGAGLRPGEILDVREFLKPRVEEICGSLPAPVARRLLGSQRWRRLLGRFTGGREIRTTTVSGYLLLRGVAALRRWRRGTFRYAEETARIEAWLDAIRRYAPDDYGLAVEIAECQRLVKGYGETFERGFGSYLAIVAAAERLRDRPDAAASIARLRRAATADDRGLALGRELAAVGAQ